MQNFANKAKGITPVQKLTEAAMMVAISVILALVAGYIPLLGMIGPLLFPLPIAILQLRHDHITAIAALAAAALISGLFLGPVAAIYLVLGYGIVGLFLGWCFRGDRSPILAMFGATILSAFSTLLGLVLSLQMAGLPMSDLMAEMYVVIDEMAAQGAAAGMTEAELFAGMTVAEVKQLMADFLPSIIITAGMMMAAASYFLFTYILRRLGFRVRKMPAFCAWHFHPYSVWFVIIGLIASTLGVRLGNDTVSLVAGNLLYAIYPLVLISGASVAWWFFKFWRVPGLYKGLTAALFILSGGFTVFLLLIIGLFDPLLDFRSRLARHPLFAAPEPKRRPDYSYRPPAERRRDPEWYADADDEAKRPVSATEDAEEEKPQE
ncbi:MAG: DUF2232 domain-containing protein [Firmicutes bacterium]|nr:DUF2232 domain-containing protein [Bacillota bacterium]